MKRILVVLLIFSSPLFAQTWVEENDSVEIEYTLLTKAQFDGLIRQYETTREYATFTFQNTMELARAEKDFVTISGNRPDFRGDYYMVGRAINFSENEKQALDIIGMTDFVMFGNINTGRFTMVFFNNLVQFYPNYFKIGSPEYKEKYTQYLNLVNGK